ncbi:hypothetical protein BKA69DRAFT_1128914 [Paraphysoderma sedebokerense]|nr:hypothetical protein BKA69DRAFT_1128914 [Paraphysoderma sedebokerense]
MSPGSPKHLMFCQAHEGMGNNTYSEYYNMLLSSNAILGVASYNLNEVDESQLPSELFSIWKSRLVEFVVLTPFFHTRRTLIALYIAVLISQKLQPENSMDFENYLAQLETYAMESEGKGEGLRRLQNYCQDIAERVYSVSSWVLPTSD